MDEALADVRDAALDHGVPVGGLGFGTGGVVEKIAAGYWIVNLGSRRSVIGATVEGWLDETRG